MIIDLIAGSNSELQTLTDKLSTSVSVYGIEISTEKIKVMGNTIRYSKVGIQVNGIQLDVVQSFTYLGVTISRNGDSAEDAHLRIIAAMSRQYLGPQMCQLLQVIQAL